MNRPTQDPLLNVDSYGCLFMYATHQDLTTAPRHIIRMTEPVRPEQLLEAVKTALKRFPQMALGLTRGETSYSYRYLKKPPVVLPFDDISPYYIGSEDTNGYLFLCGYRDSTIYLEYQHCTSDGRGFDQFIRCILYYYLRLCGHPIENDGTIRTLSSAYTLEESEDAYLKLLEAPQSDADHYPDGDAFHMPEFDDDSNELSTELTISLPQIKTYTKENGLSPVTFLMTAISHGIYRTYYTGTDHKEPIVAEIPMDLRPYVKTASTRFFLSLLDLPFPYEYLSLPFAQGCRHIRKYFDSQRALPHAAYWAIKNAERVSTAHQNDMPIAEKEALMRTQARDYIRRDSFILTNVGAFAPPVSMEPFITDYNAILPCAHQPFGFLVSSYRNTLKLSISQRDFNPDFVQNIISVLREIGFDARANISYPFHVTRYDGLHLAK